VKTGRAVLALIRERRLLSSSRLIYLAVLLLCVVALGHGWRATHNLDWPPDFDLYRDAAIAQTMLDGGGLSDPAYTGERLWYNLLVPAIVAGISRLIGWAVHTTYARAGAYLNVLALPCFYLLVVGLFKDRLIAFASTLAFLFVTCQCPLSRACATCSPWLFVANFAQGFFYLALVLDHELLTSEWRVGQILRDVVSLDLPPGRCGLSFGLWRWQDGDRLWRVDNGEPGINLGQVEFK